MGAGGKEETREVPHPSRRGLWWTGAALLSLVPLALILLPALLHGAPLAAQPPAMRTIALAPIIGALAGYALSTARAARRGTGGSMDASAAGALTALLAVRVFIDGMAFERYNAPLALAAVSVFLWAYSSTRLAGETRPEPASGPLWLLTAFIAWAALTLTATIHADETLHMLMDWCAFLMVFASAALLAARPCARQVLLGGVLLIALAQGAYALFHFFAILPATRMLLEQRPELLESAGIAASSADGVVSRLHTNRAFGVFLSPNALAALLAPGLLLSLGVLLDAFAVLRLRWGRSRAGKRREAGQTAGWTALLVGVGGFALWLLLPRAAPIGPASPAAGLLLFAVVPALLTAASAYGIVLAKGPRLATYFFVWLLGTVAALVCAAALVLTFSRGGWLAALAGVAVLVIRLKPSSPRPKGAAASAILLAVALFCTASAFPRLGADPVRGPGAPLQERLTADTLLERFDYWRAAASIAGGHPALGVGLGNFELAYPQHQPPEAGPVREAHNDYLQMAAETGFIGLALFVAFWAAMVIRAWQTSGRRLGRIPSAGLLAAVTAMLVHAAVDFSFQHPSLLAFAAVLAGMGCNGFARRHRGVAGRLYAAPVLAAALFTVFFAPGMMRVDAWLAGEDLQQARVAAEGAPTTAAKVAAGAAIADAAYPYSSELALGISGVYASMMRAAFQPEASEYGESAAAWGRLAVERSPYALAARVELANVLWALAAYVPPEDRMPLYEESLEQWMEAARLRPYRQEVWQIASGRAESLAEAVAAAGGEQRARELRKAAERAERRAAEIQRLTRKGE